MTLVVFLIVEDLCARGVLIGLNDHEESTRRRTANDQDKVQINNRP